jgi:hypothetical protein
MPPECRLATGDVSDGLPIAVDDVTKSCRYFPCASPPPDAFNRSVSRVQPAAPRHPIRTSAAGRTGCPLPPAVGSGLADQDCHRQRCRPVSTVSVLPPVAGRAGDVALVEHR